jgi:hypothetical protein
VRVRSFTNSDGFEAVIRRGRGSYAGFITSEAPVEVGGGRSTGGEGI